MGRRYDEAPLIQARAVSHQFMQRDGVRLDGLDGLSVALHRRHTGLVGPNGIGKSTLIRLLAGELAPTFGTVSRNARIGYLAQEPDFAEGAGSTITVATCLGLRTDDWELWAAEARAIAALAELGLRRDGAWLSRRVSEVSGGELTRVRLAALLVQAPEVLLLDEPTNHLDADARQALAVFLGQWRGGLLVASHDRTLLADVEEIWELTSRGLAVYGGGYDDYETQRRAEDAAAVAAVDAAQQALRRAESQQRTVRERQEQRSAGARQRAPKMGLPQIVLGGLQRQAEGTKAKLADVHARRVTAAEEQWQAARQAVRVNEQIRLTLPETSVPAGKTVLKLVGVNARVPGMPNSLWSNDVDLTLVGPARVAVTGANGVGKTTLLRLLTGDLAPSVGRVEVGVTPWAYLDQSLSLLQPTRTVLAQFRDRSPAMAETERRIRLGRLQLDTASLERPAAELSGGERVRAALALALLGERPARLLLLDEPSNHLDLASLAQLAAALAAFAGALLLISHDRRFLDEVGITRTWQVSPAGVDEL